MCEDLIDLFQCFYTVVVDVVV